MQAELVSFGIDLFDLEAEVQGAAQDFSCEVDGLAYGGRAFWLNTFYMGIGPLRIACRMYQVFPDYLDGSGDGGSGTDCQAYGVFLLSISALRQGIICLLFPVRKPAYGAWPQLAG